MGFRYAYAPQWRAVRLLAALICTCGLLGSPLVTGAAGPAIEPAIEITQPQHDEVIHDNMGAVPVAVTLQGVALAPSNRLRVLLDGNPYGADRREMTFTLEAVERGTHALQVQLIDMKETLVASSSTLTFHMWQASRLLPPRQPQPQPATK